MNKNKLYFDEDFGNAEFTWNEMSILNIDLNDINLDGNFDEVNPGTIIHVRLLAWYIKFEKRKSPKKELNEKLMPVA